MYMHKGLVCSAIGLILGTAALPALAQSAGEWTLGVGAHVVDPKSDNGSLIGGSVPIRVDSDVKPTITFEYFLRDGLGLEVLAAWPFEHDIEIPGVGKAGSTRHLPPTVSLQYHFNHRGTVSPFVGAGINYTTFFSEKTRGPLAGSKLSLDDSWGLAAHVGIDFTVGERSAIRIDARWIDIDTDVKIDGAKVGTANIDPVVYGAAYVKRF
ncbi:OmpW/AlkL family protein [Marilutibacter alkalisoli]